MAKPIPPGDFDLIERTPEQLKGEVAALTVYLAKVDGWRLRRARAMRLLRAAKVPRNEVAALADVTPGAVTNVIDDLDRGEEAWHLQEFSEPAAEATTPQDGDPPCDRCEDPFSWHVGRREHPKQTDKGCVPPPETGRICFCAQFEEPQAKESTT